MQVTKWADLGIRGKAAPKQPRQMLSVLCRALSCSGFTWQHNHEKRKRDNVRIIALRGGNNLLGHKGHPPPQVGF